jgi:hypothetical protein
MRKTETRIKQQPLRASGLLLGALALGLAGCGGSGGGGGGWAGWPGGNGGMAAAPAATPLATSRP